MSIYAHLINNIASSQALNTLAKQLLPNWVTVFMLHRLDVPELGVNGLQPDHLERCLAYLCEHGYRFISLEEAVRRTLDDSLGRDKWVAFSLDDGFAEQVTVAGPIFAKFDCPSTCFLISGFLDGDLWQWEHQLMWLLKHSTARSLDLELNEKTHTFDLQQAKAHRSIIAAIRTHAAAEAYVMVERIATSLGIRIPAEPPADEKPATWDEVRAMEAKGMQFAAHTVTHRIVSGLSDAEQEQEMTRSIARVHQECRNPANIFCYPSGQADQYDQRMFAKLRAAGVNAAFSALPGYMNGPQMRNDPDYRFKIPRMAMPDSFDEFTRYVSWAQYLYESIYGTKTRKQRAINY